LADSDEELSREPPEELTEWEADDEEDFSWGLPGELLPAELLIEEPLVEVVGRDPDGEDRFFEEPEEDVPEDRVPEEEAVLFFFAEELPEEDFFAEELVEEPAEL